MTLVHRFQNLSASKPDAPAFTFLSDGEQEGASLTRGELDTRARAVAAELVARGLRGQRVLLLYAPGLDFVVAFFGCLYSGAIAVPAYPPEPSRLARTLPRLQAVVTDCAPSLVLTTAELLEAAPLLFPLAPELAQVPWAASDEWVLRGRGDSTPEPPQASDLAFLQYTSGSTAIPKGVMVGHDNLLANLEQLQHAGRAGEHTVAVNWVPQYHDMGLVCGILAPAFLGGRSVLMSPLDFLRRPACWLRAIDKYRGNVTAAPNFALDLCARKVPASALVGLDFSCWTFALVGAEPIRRDTLDRFCDLLAPGGFHPNAILQGYGLAEAVVATALGSMDARFRSGRFDGAALNEGRVAPADDDATSARELVSSGTALLRERIEIVDPASRRRSASGRVGEIWISGPNVARGYFNREPESKETFSARLADSEEGPFLRTGDLGFLSDGELYVAGRIKDLVIVRGRNHYPQDIEHTVEACHPHLRPGGIAAFAVEDGASESLVVVAEVDTRALPEGEERPAVLASIGESIRIAVNRKHDVHVGTVALVAPGQVPKTSSGKVMRSGCRGDFLAGRLEELDRSVVAGAADVDDAPSLPFPEERSERALTLWLASWLAGRLRVPREQLTPEVPFSQVGLDSLQAVELAGEIEAALGQRLPATVFLDFPSIGALARHLSGVAEPLTTVAGISVRSSCAVALASGGTDRPVVVLPGLFGMLGAFSHLVGHLRGQFPIWGLDLPVHRGLPEPAEIAELAARYADDLLEVPNAEPYRIAGYCSGGMVAVEVGRQLELRGKRVERVLLIDAPYLEGERFALGALEAEISAFGKAFTAPTLEEAVRKVVRYIAGNNWSFGEGDDFIDRMVTGGIANLRTFQGWAPRPITIATTLVSADERIRTPLYEKDATKNAASWSRFLGRSPDLVNVPGNHHSMLQPPHVAHLAQVLTRELSRPDVPR